MKPRHQALAAAFLSVIVSGGWAAEISVAPGQGTLSAAVGAAGNGDTLVLQDGVFYGAVTVNKSLTIRPVNRATEALVDGPVTINGFGITATLQGLKFSGDVNLSQAAAIRLIENEWVSDDIEGDNYRSSEGDGTLTIVGNRFAVGSDIIRIYSDGAYIAGNVLLNGYIQTNAYAWIVGNQVYRDYAPAIEATSSAKALILANRVRCDFSYDGSCIVAAAALNLVAGNVVEVSDTSTFANAQNGIHVGGSGEATVLNNVVLGLPSFNSRSGAGIVVDAGSARVAGNIVRDWSSSSGTPIKVSSRIATVTHNLCHNNSGGCPAGEGNLNADPLFVNLTDFALGAGSPAINAGPTDDGLADLNRTRNDMGVHGGPWSIGQYDAQRAPGNYAPFVYPLFKVGSSLSGGLVDIQALGVARLR
jgi:hypothetical protein